MRHFLLPLAVAAGTFGVGEATLASALVTPPGLAYRGTTAYLRAAPSAIDLATVARVADVYLHAAACAKKQPSRDPHRLAPSSR
jgi:hypothetical protein